MSKPSNKSLIQELESIRKSLDDILESAEIPTLDDVIDQATLGQKSLDGINPENPFLSSDSLSELIKIRNEAVARLQENKQAEALSNSSTARAKLPTSANEQTDTANAKKESVASASTSIEAEEIVAHMDSCFRSWKTQLVRKCVKNFEQELNSRLEHDFQLFVQEHLQQQQLSEHDQLIHPIKPPTK